MTIRKTCCGGLVDVDGVVWPHAIQSIATTARAARCFIQSEFTESGSQEALRQTNGTSRRGRTSSQCGSGKAATRRIGKHAAHRTRPSRSANPHPRPGLLAVAVTTAAFSGCDVTVMEHETVVVPL